MPLFCALFATAEEVGLDTRFHSLIGVCETPDFHGGLGDHFFVTRLSTKGTTDGLAALSACEDELIDAQWIKVGSEEKS